jgi:uncharacterized protein YecT (DUF1311 family)
MIGALLALIVGVLVAGSAAARADEMDGWCAQVKKASSVVICSDPELRQQAIARNKLFETAREKLSADEYKALTVDQSRWVKSYTARCGVSLDGPVPVLPVPQNVIDCYRREARARTAVLGERFSEPNAMAIPPQAPSSTSRLDDEVNDVLVRAGMPRPVVEAMAAWDGCTEAAVDKFADQPEPARTVAEAAMATCRAEEYKYMRAAGINVTDPAAVEQAWMPDLLARVMAIRAARAKLRKGNPETKPAIDYNRM